MVWRPPQELEQSRRARWRAAVLWGLLGVLVVAALGVQAAVTRAAQVPLTPPIRVGPLTAQVPRGWTSSAELGPPQIRARVDDSAGGGTRLLTVTLRRTRQPLASPTEFLAVHYEGAQAYDAPRRATVAGRDGVVVGFAASVGFPGLGLSRSAFVTAAVAQVDPRTFVHVEHRRFDEPDGRDAVLVKQVARTVALAD